MSEMSFPYPNIAWAFARAKHSGGHRHHRDDPEDAGAFRYMRGGPGFGRGGHGFGRGGPRGFEDFRFGGGRGQSPFGGRGRARRGEVRIALLLLLAEEPRNGYGLMQEIEQRSGGAWRPSPGSVYPTLAQLEDEGLVRATEAEGGRRFEITDDGRQQVAERGEQPPPWEMPAEHHGASLWWEFAQLAKATKQIADVGDEQQVADAQKIVADARRALYRILAEDQQG